MPFGLTLDTMHFGVVSGLAMGWFLVASPIVYLLAGLGKLDLAFSLAADNRGMVAIVTGAS